MTEKSFQDLINDQRKIKVSENFSGNLLQYLNKVKENPDIANFAPGRIYNMIMKYGTTPIEDDLKITGYEDLVKYNFFDGKIFGTYEAIHDIMRFMKASARRTETGKRILIMVGPVSSGKCLSGDTKIYNTEDGKFYTIRDIVNEKKSIKVQSYDLNGKFKEIRVSNFFKNGKQDLYKITTKKGSVVKSTKNHQFLTMNGWKTVEDLNVNDYISVTRNLHFNEDPCTISIDHIKLYGYYITEGHNKNRGIAFSNIDPEIILDFDKCCRSIEPECSLKNYDKEGRTWNPTTERGKHNKIKDFVREYDLEKNSYEKSINDKMFSLSDIDISILLGTMWSCDGTISKDGYPSYSTSSIKLANDVRNLMLRLGIMTTMTIKKTYARDNYNISVFGNEYLNIFYNTISQYIIGKKRNRIESIINYRDKNQSDVFCGTEIYPLLVEEYKGVGFSINGKYDGIRNHKTRIDYYQRQNISRDKLREISENCKSDVLMNIVNSDIAYDKIVSIEYCGEEETFDIEVPFNHNFVIDGGIITHNSTISSLIKKGLEADDTPKYAIKGCPIHEEPLHAIPIEDREFWMDKLGVKIEGTLCPVCQHMIDENYTDENGNVKWEDIPVESIKFSEQRRVGVGTFQPSDPKCVSYDTIILSNKGMLDFSELQELYKTEENEEVSIDMIIEGIDGKEKAAFFYNNGIQETIEIVTKMGYSEKVTKVHPLLVIRDGVVQWCKSEDLREGDYIGLKKGQMIFGNDDNLPEFIYNGPNPIGNNKNMTFPDTLTPELSKVLGYIVSEGSYDAYSMWFSNLSEELKEDFNKNFYSVFNVKPKTYERACSVSSIKLCSFLENVCKIKHGAANKDIPYVVRKSSKDNIISFLEGLFWGDGTISTRLKTNSNRFGYSSNSEKLIDQLQVILLNFGIVSSKEKYVSKDGFVNYCLNVTGDETLKIVDLIPSLINKKTDEGVFIDKRDCSNWDVIPCLQPLFSEIFDGIRKEYGPVYKIKEISNFERYKSYSTWGRNPRRSTILNFVNIVKKIGFSSNELDIIEKLALDNNTIWLKINKINDSGYQQVYDINVPGTHSFCANGFINHNSQDHSELIGRVNFAKMSRYSETDPRAYEFNGELQVANGGMIEYIEILKADIKFHYILITAAQEQLIKAPGFPQMYIDTLILGHSVVGDEPVPYRKNGIIMFDTIKNLVEKNDIDIEVISINLETKKPEWTKVVSFYSHPFTGSLIKTIQKNGVISTTFNHSIYSTDYECFYPDDKKNVLALRNIPKNDVCERFNIDIDDSMVVENGMVRIKDIDGYQGNGMYRKNKVKYEYDLINDEKSSNTILKTFAWYISEGHTSNREAVISQNNVDILNTMKDEIQEITTTALSVQDRSDKEDGTSRLRLPSTIWSRILEANCGKLSTNKKIPSFIFNLPDKFKAFFLKELIKGDGCFNDRKMINEYFDNHFEYTTVSKMLASQIGFLCSQLKCDFSIKHSYTKTGKDIYYVRSRNKENNVHNNEIEIYDVENEIVYDIECLNNHSFVSGVGNIVCHNTNQNEFDSFKSDKKNEALHDRMYPVVVPWNLRVDDEIKIYEKMIRESDFRGIHIAPNTLKIAAQFAVLSRLKKSTKVSSLIEKMKIYNGEETQEFKRSEVNLKELLAEGRRNGEGMTGISPRFIINALNIALGMKEDKKCINPIDVIKALRNNFEHHIGISEEEKKEFLGLLIGGKESVAAEYKDVAKKEVNMAFIYAYEEQAQALFNNYMNNVTAFCKKEKVFDSITGEYSDPDEKLMRSLEELIEVPENSKKEFRNQIFVHESSVLRQGRSFTYNDYDPLREAVEKKLMKDLKNVVSLSIADTTNVNPKTSKKREEALEKLIERGYCKECANILLSFVAEVIRKES
jgi:serine protein kinase